MHACLRVHEILANIFTGITTEDPAHLFGRAGLNTLGSLATTCKTFTEPALDALWDTQPSLFQLLKNLPSDAINIEMKKSGWATPLLVSSFVEKKKYLADLGNFAPFTP